MESFVWKFVLFSLLTMLLRLIPGAVLNADLQSWEYGADISSVESQKGIIIIIQWCSFENQKGTVAKQKGIIIIQWCSFENQKGTIAKDFLQR